MNQVNIFFVRVVKVLMPCLVILAFSCAEPGKDEGLSVSGRIRNAKDAKLVFQELDVGSLHGIDSVTLDGMGLFRFTCHPEEEGFYILKFPNGDHIILLAGRGEEVFVEADLGNKTFTYSVKGSPGSDLLREFYTRTNENLKKADSLRSVLMQNRESADFYQLSVSFDTLFMKIMEDQKLFEENMIGQNPGSLASLMMLNFKFGPGPVLNMEDDLQVYKDLDSVLTKKYPSNKHVLFHHRRIIEYQQIQKDRESRKRSNF